MTQEQEKMIRDRLDTQFRKVRTISMAASAKAVANVVLEFITAKKDYSKLTKKELVSLIDEIKDFCVVGLGAEYNAAKNIEKMPDEEIEKLRKEHEELIKSLPQNVQDAINYIPKEDSNETKTE